MKADYDCDCEFNASLAIDGPAASGKTVVGKELARRLGIRFLDTGTMYRAVTWASIRRGIAPNCADDLSALARDANMELVAVAGIAGEDRLLLDGEDITGSLRLPEIDANVSAVSAVSGVRRALVAQQRAIAAAGAIVMCGRDIGTVVLPDARVKVFLTASAEVRAERRAAEMKQDQKPADYDDVLDALRRRDKIDSARDDSPLRPVADATIICSDEMTIDEVVIEIISLVKKC